MLREDDLGSAGKRRQVLSVIGTTSGNSPSFATIELQMQEPKLGMLVVLSYLGSYLEGANHAIVVDPSGNCTESVAVAFRTSDSSAWRLDSFSALKDQTNLRVVLPIVESIKL